MDTYVARFAAWAPGFTGIEDWKAWARGERAIPQTAESPALEYTDPLYRRRLSQVSRMTIEVIHDVLPIEKDTRLVFVSFRGELARQFSINRMLAGDGDIKPAAFSLSVFNTPPASAAIAL
ncbi:MAG: beta-ketoacyl synthase chain length factor, partial [Spirochaetaceae bacterium]|nr:beta-ketoacyl synthase chain length factor [Spirochaetaceae bacterium]